MTIAELRVFSSPADAVAVSFLAWNRRWRKGVLSGAAVNVPCGACTACCTCHVEVRADYDGDVTAYDTERTPEGTLRLRQRADGTCIYLEGGRCTIYARRPFQCRSFDCRTVLAAGTAIAEPGTDTIGATCEAAYRKFRIVARTSDDRLAMTAVKLRMLEIMREAGIPADHPAFAYVVINAALLSWERCLDAARHLTSRLEEAWRQGGLSAMMAAAAPPKRLP
jgi:Fe-S-cluster containining protein